MRAGPDSRKGVSLSCTPGESRASRTGAERTGIRTAVQRRHAGELASKVAFFGGAEKAAATVPFSARICRGRVSQNSPAAGLRCLIARWQTERASGRSGDLLFPLGANPRNCAAIHPVSGLPGLAAAGVRKPLGRRCTGDGDYRASRTHSRSPLPLVATSGFAELALIRPNWRRAVGLPFRTRSMGRRAGGDRRSFASLVAANPFAPAAREGCSSQKG